MHKKKLIDWREWPQTRTTVRTIVHGPEDDLGRQSFTLLWWDRYGKPKGQCFFANMAETRQRLLTTIRERTSGKTSRGSRTSSTADIPNARRS